MIKIVDRLPTEGEYRRVRHLILQQPERAGHPVMDDQLAPVLAACPQLESVVLSGVPDLSDGTIATLARTASNLQGINLNGCGHITDAGILELTARSLPLQWIRLNGVPGLTDASVSAISRTCPQLMDLEACDLPLISSLSVREVWTHARKLRSLRLARCPLLTDTAFPTSSLVTDRGWGVEEDRNQSSTRFPPLPRYSAENLRNLDLAYCKITDRSLEGIITHAPKLQTLFLTGCDKLTDQAFDAICKLGDNLDVLGVSHVPSLTDAAIVRLARACSRLRGVDVGFCDNLTDMSVFELASLSGLRRLSLTGLQNITDIAIHAIAEHATELERLHLSHCQHISLRTMRILLDRLKMLQQFAVTGVPCFLIEGIGQFSEQPPAHLSAEQRAAFRVYQGQNIGSLRDFLDEEEQHQVVAEMQAAAGIAFVPQPG